jgi:hypothetical protein
MLFPNVKIRKKGEKDKSFFLKPELIKISYGFCAIAFLLALNACRSPQKIEMRNLVPNNAIVYLETNDLSKTLESLTASQAFQSLTETQPNFSALGNMQLAVAVTGFETSEENTTLNFKPQFVAVIETHAWSWQTVSFAENQIDNFIRRYYGEDAKLETTKKENGKYFVWTANDNRRAFAFVRESLIYFGNDAATIEKCLAIKNGEVQSLLTNESLTRAYSANNLAFGFVSPEGASQIANLAGVSIAVQSTEESDERSFIARVLPQILQNTTREIVWTANKTERGIEDKFEVFLTAETASVANKTLAADAVNDSIVFLPADFFSATRYNLENPLTAWRTALLLTARNTDQISGKLLIEFSDALLEPYGVSNAETFLSSIDGEILTVLFDENAEKSATIVTVKDAEKLKGSITREINFRSIPIRQEAVEIWLSENKQMAAAFVENKLVLGDYESVLKCLRARQSGLNNAKNSMYQNFTLSKSVAATFARDINSAEKIVGVLGKKNDESKKIATFYLTETRFTERGIERVTVSDFGLIGTIVKQFSN